MIEPAKSSRGLCTNCKRFIDKDTLRLQVADDREFRAYVMSHGGFSVFHGEGMSRGGYIETEDGVISIKRYWVHLNCYRPIKLHPWTADQFRLQNCKTSHRAVFNAWLEGKNAGSPQTQPAIQIPKKKKTAKREAVESEEEYEEVRPKKSKKINKRK